MDSKNVPNLTQEVNPAAEETAAEERSKVIELLKRTPGVHYDELPVKPLVSVEQAQQMGRNALANAELAKDLTEVEQPEEFVGEETPLQVEEHLAEDRAAYQVEHGKGLALEQRVVKNTQEGVAREAERAVGKFLHAKNPVLFELEAFRNQEMRNVLHLFGRNFGDRNEAA